MTFKRSSNSNFSPYSWELPIFREWTKARHWEWGNWGTEWFGSELCRERQQCHIWTLPGQLLGGIGGDISQGPPFSVGDLLGEPLVMLEVPGCKSCYLCSLQGSHGDSRTDPCWDRDRATLWPHRWWQLRQGSVWQSSAAGWRILIRTGKK